jgi:hypothetical protein
VKKKKGGERIKYRKKYVIEKYVKNGKKYGGEGGM